MITAINNPLDSRPMLRNHESEPDEGSIPEKIDIVHETNLLILDSHEAAGVKVEKSLLNFPQEVVPTTVLESLSPYNLCKEQLPGQNK